MIKNNIKLLLACMLIISTVITGCSSGGGADNGAASSKADGSQNQTAGEEKSEDAQKEADPAEMLIGEWKATTVYQDGEDIDVKYNSRYIFNEDGTVVHNFIDLSQVPEEELRSIDFTSFEAINEFYAQKGTEKSTSPINYIVGDEDDGTVLVREDGSKIIRIYSEEMFDTGIENPHTKMNEMLSFDVYLNTRDGKLYSGLRYGLDDLKEIFDASVSTEDSDAFDTGIKNRSYMVFEKAE